MKQDNKIKILKIITLIIVIAILIIATIQMIPIMKQINTPEGQAEFKEKVSESSFNGVLMIFGLEVAQVLLAVLPGEPIEILAGLCFGPIWGTILIMVSAFIITCVIYFLVRKMGRNFIYAFFSKEKVDKLEKSKLFNDEKKIEMVMAILFIVPGTPKDLLVYLGGLLPIKPSRFIVISTLLRFPSIISSTIAGDNILEGNWSVTILAYIITFLITFIIIFFVNKLDKNKTTEDILQSLKNKEL